jgi:protein-S-isoprenylcysteine O-methyltransferase Ste14
LYFILALIGYFVLHSWLAAEGTKRRVLALTGWSRAGYRLGFNAISVFGLVAVAWLYLRLPPWPLWSAAGVVTGLGWLILVAGVVVIYLAMRPYDTAEFIGLRAPEHAAGLGDLSTGGLNAYVRHPLYFGTLLCFWGNVVRTGSGNALVLAVIGTAYLYIGAYLEERKLVAAFGADYEAYRSRTPMLIPRFM